MRGGGNVVSEYTGIIFSEGTSVGIGPIMEFYINFGQMGLVLGALFTGLLMGYCDGRAGASLARGDGWGGARWYLLGFPLVNALASFAEIIMAYGAILVMILSVERGLFRTRWYQRQIGSVTTKTELRSLTVPA